MLRAVLCPGGDLRLKICLNKHWSSMWHAQLYCILHRILYRTWRSWELCRNLQVSQDVACCSTLAFCMSPESGTSQATYQYWLQAPHQLCSKALQVHQQPSSQVQSNVSVLAPGSSPAVSKNHAGTSTAKQPSGCSGQGRLSRPRRLCCCSPRRATAPATSQTCSVCGMR